MKQGIKKEIRVCKNCSPKGEVAKNYHTGKNHKDISVWECCLCKFKTYYDNNENELTKEEAFARYPELVKERKDRIDELKKHINCDCAEHAIDMWCWDKPWIKCEIKTIKEELEGKCQVPMPASKHIDEILTHNTFHQ